MPSIRVRFIFVGLLSAWAIGTAPLSVAQEGAISATEESPCPEGAERAGSKPPEGERSGCVIELNGGKVPHGPQTWWYPGGTKRQESYYLNGKAHGPKLDWGIRGNLMQKWEFENGVLQGEHVIYSPAGSVMRRETYVDGNKVTSSTAEKRSQPRPGSKTSSRSKPKISPRTRTIPKPRINKSVVSCELQAEALERKIAEDRKYIESLTRGQLRLVHQPARLTARIEFIQGKAGKPRLEGAFVYRLESTSELGSPSNDPIQASAREREAELRGQAGVLQDQLGDLFQQWRSLMGDTFEEETSMAAASDVVFHEADLQKTGGETYPSRLVYSAREDAGSRLEIRLQHCRNSR